MITDKDVMYIYSEVINQMEPQKILDVGMFYKAIGGSITQNIRNGSTRRLSYYRS